MKTLAFFVTFAQVLTFQVSALASENRLTKNFNLRSSEGLDITVSAIVQETAPDAFGNQTRTLKQMSIQTSEFGSFRAVVVLNCTTYRYPNSSTYQSSFQMDGFQSSGGAPFVAADYSSRQIDYAGFGGDNDSCRVELALVKNGVWQTDPVNGTHNFILEL
jgi:hypothetical protein